MATKKQIEIKIVKDQENDDYEVLWIEDGKRIEAKTYYTDDKEDAELTKTVMEKEAAKETVEESKMGLLPHSLDGIFIDKGWHEGYQVCCIRTKPILSNCSTALFTFETEDQAMDAGLRIARAIGGIFYGFDPRNLAREK